MFLVVAGLRLVVEEPRRSTGTRCSVLAAGAAPRSCTLHRAGGQRVGVTGTEAFSILTQCQTRRVGMCSVLGEAERALLQAALLLLHLQPCTVKQHHISPQQ